MARQNDGKTLHYHIRWSSSTLDWQRFNTRKEAEEGARQRVRLHESYTIQEFDKDCVRCRAT